jgi:hypothetical protein
MRRRAAASRARRLLATMDRILADDPVYADELRAIADELRVVVGP